MLPVAGRVLPRREVDDFENQGIGLVEGEELGATLGNREALRLHASIEVPAQALLVQPRLPSGDIAVRQELSLVGR